MLPAERRVRRREDFTATVRDGRRAGAPGLVVHAAIRSDSQPARAGFVVGRAVGTAVTRNRVRRQLRHLLAPRIATMPAGTDVVVRVTPGAARLPADDLASTLDRLLDRTVGRGAA